jgi:hypothetical protein
VVARSGWYVYVDFSGKRWAVRLPVAIGAHPALGFEPLTDPNRVRPVKRGGSRP